MPDEYGYVWGMSMEEEADLIHREESNDAMEHTRHQKRQKRRTFDDRELSFRWLPGDLKSHTISQAMAGTSVDNDETLIALSSSLNAAKLVGIDRRARSDRPWWALEGDKIDTENDDASSALEGSSKDGPPSATG